MTPTLAVTLGDAAGIGPEIVLRTLTRGASNARLLVIGSADALRRELPHVDGAHLPPVVADPAQLAEVPGGAGLWEPSAPLAALPAYGTIDAEAGRASHAWVLQAAELAGAGRVDGIVTGPIHKAAWNAAGIDSPGHTEALCEAAGAERVLMMLAGGRLRVALATIHVPLRTVADRLDRQRIAGDLVLLAREVARAFGPQQPRIAVCGLNPHAGEEGLFGSEDAEVIAPAVADARAAGVDAHGPLPADACIPAGAAGSYDAVFAMYHDQALPAVKTLAPRQSVNITLGLPFLRTSVDHGTAFDIAGRGRATDESLRAALGMATAIARYQIEVSGRRDATSGLNPASPPSDLT